MNEKEWSFTSTVTHPDGTTVDVVMTVPAKVSSTWRNALVTDGKSVPPEPVLECSELAQMGAVRAMSAYVATKHANDLKAPF